jgi:hypothetical protein
MGKTSTKPRSRRRRRVATPRSPVPAARPYSSGTYQVNRRGEVSVVPRRGLA